MSNSMTVEEFKAEVTKKHSLISSELGDAEKCMADPVLRRFWEGRVSVLNDYKDFVETVLKMLG